MSFHFKQPSAGRIRNQRRFFLLLIIVAITSISTVLFLESLNLELGWESIGRATGLIGIASKLGARARPMGAPDFVYFPDRSGSKQGGEKSIVGDTVALHDSKEEWNHMPRGLFISKLRQQQAKLIRMNYWAMLHPMKKPMFPFDEAQTLRKNVVANVCTTLEENSFGAKPPIPEHLLVDDNHNLVFCQIRKVASITWRQALDEAATKKGRHKIRRLNTYTPEERDYRLKRYTKIMFVREPILRVVSGWYDKFIMTNDRDQLHYAMHYGCDIARRSRKNISHIKLCRQDEPDVADDEFTAADFLSRLKEARTLRISFEEFARYLINGPVAIKNDMHWETYNSRCQPCQVGYDYIGHYETLEGDARTIMQRVGLGKDAPPFPARMSRSEDIAREVLSDLDPLLLMRLSELYHLDYQLFGYNLRKLQEWVDEDLDGTMFNRNY